MVYGLVALSSLTAVPDYAHAWQATGPVWTVTAPAENVTPLTVVHTSSTYAGTANRLTVTYCWAAGTYVSGTEPTKFTIAVIEGTAPNDVPYPVTFTGMAATVPHGTDTCLEITGSTFLVGFDNIQGSRQGRFRIHPARGSTLYTPREVTVTLQP